MSNTKEEAIEKVKQDQIEHVIWGLEWMMKEEQCADYILLLKSMRNRLYWANGKEEIPEFLINNHLK